jgi:hypothetical protein
MGIRFFNKLFRSAEWFLEFWVLFGFLKLSLGFKNALFIGTKNGATFRLPSRQIFAIWVGGALAPPGYPTVPLVSLVKQIFSLERSTYSSKKIKFTKEKLWRILVVMDYI